MILKVSKVFSISVSFVIGELSNNFDTDLNNLSYHPKELKYKESKYTGLDPNKDNKVLIYSEASTLNESLIIADELFQTLKSFEDSSVKQIFSVSPFVIVPSLANNRLDSWKGFWDENFDIVYKTFFFHSNFAFVSQLLFKLKTILLNYYQLKRHFLR